MGRESPNPKSCAQPPPASCRHIRGAKAARALARDIERCPACGVPFWLAQAQLLQAEASAPACNDTAKARKACKRARGELDACFEKAVALHGAASAELWVAWVACKRRVSQPVGELIQRAVGMLDASSVDAFVSEVQGSDLL